MGSLRYSISLLAALVIGLSACSQPAQTTSAQGSKAPIEDKGAPTEVDPLEDAAGTDTQTDFAGTDNAPLEDEAADAVGLEKNKAQAKSKDKLRPLKFPYKNTVDVETIIEPACVERGDTIELSVTTPPKAAIAYQAIYSDNKSGAGSPFGENYGGNDKGYADDSGHYVSTWVIAPHAPAGRARADVYVGFEGEWGYANARFAVADADGNCPQDWLEGEEQ